MNWLTRINMLASATIIGALLLSSCSPDEDEIVVEKEVIRPVKLLEIKAMDAANIRRFPAELKASEEALLAFRVGGQLMKVHVVSGQRVTQDELLAELDPTDFILQVELAQANQVLAEAQFERIQTMMSQNATMQSQFDSTKATLDQANNALQTATNQLKYTKIYAPFSGVIASVMTENFQYVAATQTLMHIQNIDELEVDFQIPESLVVSIRSTQDNYRPNIVVDVAQDDQLYGVYKEHKTTPDQNTKAYDVTLRLVRESGTAQHTLLPGMTANVDIDLSQLLGTEKHFIVPVEAVVRHEDTNTGKAQSVVWVFNSATNMVETRNVVVGALEGNQIEIISGLNAGDKVVAAGVSSLTANMQVRPWTRERGL